MKAKGLITLSIMAHAVFMGLVLVGCGKAGPPPAPSPQKTSTSSMPSLNTPQVVPPPPGAAPAAAVAPTEVPTYEGKDEAERLTKALHDYYNRSGATAPAITSFEPLVKAGLLKSVPVPPPGKKYVIDLKQSQVRLVNQ